MRLSALAINAVLLATLLPALPARAASGPKVALCPANSYSAVDLAQALSDDGSLGEVTVLDCGYGTPTLAELQRYDAVLAWDYYSFDDNAALGDVLADYLDSGHGVVLGMDTFDSYYALRGRFMTDSYLCLTTGSTSYNQRTLKATPNDPASPLVQGVGVFSCAETASVKLAVGATSVWDYTDGTPAVATCEPGGHLLINLNYSPSNVVSDEAVTLIRNALLVAARGLALQASPATLTLPDTGVGSSSAPGSVRYTNVSDAVQTVTSLALRGANATDFGLVALPTLPATLAPSESLDVKVRFTPTAEGARQALLEAQLASGSSARAALRGQGVPARLTVTPAPIEAGSTAVGSSVTREVTIANAGAGRILVKAIAAAADDGGGDYSVEDLPALPVAVSGGASFTLSVRFSPSAEGARPGTLTVETGDAGAAKLEVPIAGYSGAPALELGAGALGFGKVNVGARSATLQLTVRNAGYADLVIDDAQLDGANPGDFHLEAMGATLPLTIPPQQSAMLPVYFEPSAAGARGARLTLSSNDATEPSTTVMLQGTGTTASLMAAPTTLDLGMARVGAAGAPGALVLSSVGDGNVSVMAVSFTGADADSFVVSGTTPTIVPAGGQATLKLACKPSQLGTLTADANLVTDVGTTRVTLSCVGVSPTLRITPDTTLDFGSVPMATASTEQALTLENTGDAPLTLSSFAIAGTDADDFRASDLPSLPATLAPGDKLVLHAVFSPSRAAMEEARIDYRSDDPQLATGSVRLIGVGEQPGIAVDPTALDFGVLAVGQSATQTVTIRNTGEAPLAISSLVLSGAGATSYQLGRQVAIGMPLVVPPQQSTDVPVSFLSASVGPQDATLVVTATGLLPVSIALRAVGYSPTVRLALADGGRVIDFGDVAVGETSQAAEVRLKNTSPAPITIAAITSSKAAFIVDSTQTTLALMPDEETTFTVRFAPTEGGTAASHVQVQVAGGTAIAVTARGRGMGGTSGCSVGALGTGGGATGGFGGWALLLLSAGWLLMRRRPRGFVLSMTLLALTLSSRAALAAGSLSATPTSLQFDATPTGTQSAPLTVKLTNGSTQMATISSLTIEGDDFILATPFTPIGLAAGGELDVDVVFAPKLDGARTGVLHAQVQGETGTLDVALKGDGLGPKLVVTPSPIVLGGVPFGQAVAPVTFTVENQGGATVNVSAVSLDGPDAGEFALSELPDLSQPRALGPGEHFSATVAFNPTQAGPAEATLVVESDYPGAPTLSAPVRGAVGDPAIDLDVGTVLFGAQNLGAMAAAQTITLTNSGYSALRLDSITLSGMNPGDFSLTTPATPALPAELPVGGQYQFQVGFSPTVAGARSASVVIASNAPTRTLALSGEGTAPGASVTPSTLDLGMVKVGATAYASFSISNDGTGPLTITRLAITGANAAAFTATTTAPFVVVPGSSAPVAVAFAPKSITHAAAQIELATDDPALPSFAIMLVGDSVSPHLAVSPATLDFGGVSVGTDAPTQQLTVRNTGNLPLQLSALRAASSGTGAYAISPAPTLPLTIAAGDSATLTVGYHPADNQGDDGTLTLTTDDPDARTATIALKGYGQQAVGQFVPDDLSLFDFGKVTVGSSGKSQGVRIDNTGDAPLVITSLSVTPTGAFYAMEATPLQVAAGESTVVHLGFTPQRAQAYSATLAVSVAGSSAPVARYTLQGTGVSPMISAVDPGGGNELDFGPVFVGVESNPLSLTLRNDSAVSQQVVVVSTSPAFLIDDTPVAVPPGGAVQVPVVFLPDDAQSYMERAQVFLDGSTTPLTAVLLTGEGVQSDLTASKGGCSIEAMHDDARPTTGAVMLLLGARLLLFARRRRSSPR